MPKLEHLSLARGFPVGKELLDVLAGCKHLKRLTLVSFGRKKFQRAEVDAFAERMSLESMDISSIK